MSTNTQWGATLWQARFKTSKTKNVGIYDSTGSLIASLDVHQFATSDVAVRRLNEARLMAATPELLKACRQAIEALKGREDDGFLRDVIAQATGGES